ncbi:uncharacterized protein LOC122257779 [Penaeus japonicus]|uniref:uncharacterized protein LOC122257779 n=1 Tax=Penaeus japonicus TaxID=27405 RepID=UPI001C712BBB|nr:uncharacterized protein LOC122257779 [Penaeus japonicus]
MVIPIIAIIISIIIAFTRRCHRYRHPHLPPPPSPDAPVVGLRLGRALNPRLIKEGDDVYFECDVEANPPFHRVDWFHNGAALEHDASAGVLVSGLSLAMREVQRQRSGSYTCRVANSEAATSSNTVHLTVKHRPVCAARPRTQGAAIGSLSTVRCAVEAEPSRGLTWGWTRTLADGSEVAVPEEDIRSEGATSLVLVRLRKPEDYGQLLCRATNEVGLQRQACVVTHVPAGPPDTPSNCTAAPVSPEAPSRSAALAVSCLEGFDGGLPQSFLLETWQEGVLVANTSSEFPAWLVTNLRAGEGVSMRISAHNDRGTSKILLLEVLTTSAEHHASPADSAGIGKRLPLFGIAATSVAVLLICLAVSMVAVMRLQPRPKKTVVEVTLTPTASGGYDPDVVKSIQCRPHSLDVLPHIPVEYARKKDGQRLSSYECHKVNNGFPVDDHRCTPGNPCKCTCNYKHFQVQSSCSRSHKDRERQDRFTESHNEDSGLSELELDPDLQRLMPSGRDLASEHQEGGGKSVEDLLSGNAPYVQSLRNSLPPFKGEAYVEGRSDALVVRDRAKILILSQKSPIADGMESSRLCASVNSSEKIPNSLPRPQMIGPFDEMASVPKQLASGIRSKRPGTLRHACSSVILCRPNESRMYRCLVMHVATKYRYSDNVTYDVTSRKIPLSSTYGNG